MGGKNRGFKNTPSGVKRSKSDYGCCRGDVGLSCSDATDALGDVSVVEQNDFARTDNEAFYLYFLMSDWPSVCSCGVG
jgi:hypothetical protein